MSKNDYERYKDRNVLELDGKKKEKLDKGVCPFCGNKLKSYGNNRFKCLASKIPKKKKYGRVNPYYNRYKKQAVERHESLTMDDENCEKEYWKKNGKWYKYRESNSKNQIIDCAGIKRPNYRNIGDTIIRGIEAKASYNDFKSGFCTGADITYIIAPEGIIPKEEMPKYIGLIEVNFRELEIIIKPKVHVVGIDIKKRATTNKSEMFYGDTRKERIYSFIQKIAKRNTMSKVFGNNLYK